MKKEAKNIKHKLEPGDLVGFWGFNDYDNYEVLYPCDLDGKTLDREFIYLNPSNKMDYKGIFVKYYWPSVFRQECGMFYLLGQNIYVEADVIRLEKFVVKL